MLHSLENDEAIDLSGMMQIMAKERKYYRIPPEGKKLLTHKKEEWKIIYTGSKLHNRRGMK